MTIEVQLRITLLGDGAVGKTSLRRRFLGKGFVGSHQMTIGADFAVMRQEIRNYNAVYQIWDLAGQSSFKTVRARFFKGSLGGACVFDLTRRDSFTNITMWIEELWRNSGFDHPVPIILIGNKSDLPKERKVKQEEGKRFAEALTQKTKKYGYTVNYIETSAKNGENVEEAFRVLGDEIITKIIEKK